MSCKVANEMIAWEGCLNCSSQDIVVDRTVQSETLPCLLNKKPYLIFFNKKP